MKVSTDAELPSLSAARRLKLNCALSTAGPPVYAATARYEPLGIAALEAAFSRCAIVANDIPSFREFWGDAALYFRTNDAGSLAETLRQLDADRALRQAYADRAYTRARERFTTKRMIDDYLDLYRSPGLSQHPGRLTSLSCTRSLHPVSLSSPFVVIRIILLHCHPE